jgi:RimJ/RimL family protein N-acetyltransferase
MAVMTGLLKDGSRVVVSHAEPGDAAEIVAYIERVSGESDFLSFGPGEFGLTVEDERKFITALGGGRSGFMLKGVVGGKIESVCTIQRSGRSRVGHIGTFGISVARSHWGLGLGRAMCAAMLEVARGTGVTKVDLRVREDNARAIHLYESLGFRREGVAQRGMKIGDRYLADVIMGACLD